MLVGREVGRGGGEGECLGGWREGDGRDDCRGGHRKWLYRYRLKGWGLD